MWCGEYNTLCVAFAATAYARRGIQGYQGPKTPKLNAKVVYPIKGGIFNGKAAAAFALSLFIFLFILGWPLRAVSSQTTQRNTNRSTEPSCC